MVTGNGNGVELRHVVGGVLENVADDTHGHIRRIDVGVTYHEFLQNIVLNGTGHDLLVYALFFTGYDEEGQDRKNGAVHGHGYGHLVQRDAGEQDVHVQHGANGYACFTNVAYYTGVIRVVAAMRRQVEGDRQTFLARCQVAAVESVGFFCGGETGVLTYRPGTEYVHGGVRPAQERRNAAHEIQMVAFFVNFIRVQRINRDTFQGGAFQAIPVFTGLLFQTFLPVLVGAGRMFRKTNLGEIRIQICHYSIIPFLFCKSFRISKQLADTLIKSSTPASRYVCFISFAGAPARNSFMFGLAAFSSGAMPGTSSG